MLNNEVNVQFFLLDQMLFSLTTVLQIFSNYHFQYSSEVSAIIYNNDG